MGYHRAGFDVIGVDINPQPHYPFELHQADAMTWPLDGYDTIHASPPCQHYSTMSKRGTDIASRHPDLVDPIRTRLQSAGIPWVMENVQGAPLNNYVRLCGSSFGLGVRRHRLFETSWTVWAPPRCDHRSQTPRYRVFDHGRWYLSAVAPVYGRGGGKAKQHWSEAMGIDWMEKHELAEAIPPAFTEWIGGQLLGTLQTEAA